VRERINALLSEFEQIASGLRSCFGPIPVPLPPAKDITRMTQLKRYEDALDALVCAWVGTEYLAGRTVPLGDDTAAIWCPRDVVLEEARKAG
jgi:predicted RNase H-like nuclease